MQILVMLTCWKPAIAEPEKVNNDEGLYERNKHFQTKCLKIKHVENSVLRVRLKNFIARY